MFSFDIGILYLTSKFMNDSKDKYKMSYSSKHGVFYKIQSTFGLGTDFKYEFFIIF